MTSPASAGLSGDPFALADEAARRLAELTGVARHDIALVLGSGWGGAADLLGEALAEVPAGDVPGFRAPVGAGHGATSRSGRVTGSGPPRHAQVPGSRTHRDAGRAPQARAHARA